MTTPVACVDAQTFVDVIQRLYAERFTGRMMIDWAEGHPLVVEFPAPPMTIRLDTGKKAAQS